MATTTGFRAAHFHRSVELLAAILNAPTPADKQMERYFRAHREMGARDRGNVAETVYGCLRRGRELAWWSGSPEPRAWVFAYLLRVAGSGVDAVVALDRRPDTRAVADRILAQHGDPPAAVRANLPDPLWARLSEQRGSADASRLAAALNQPAPVDLRANTRVATRDELRAELARAGIDCEPTPRSPWGLRRHDRRPLFATEAFRRGAFEIQDEGSQLISMLVDPRPGERVVDFCAGGGGKTLHLGMLMNGKGTLYAFDVNARRLDALKTRVKRAGLDNVRMQLIKSERDPHVKRLRGTIDRVLVDAPCSGTGTLRRNPDLKWRALDLDALVAAQRAILAAAAPLAKPGGRVVYATCSVLNDENDAVVSDFLAAHPEFEPEPADALPPTLAKELSAGRPGLSLYPHIHGTDGFYMAALRRRRRADIDTVE
jgi:16S rRNA (cytosine967-C5)-methyltransferase